MNRGFIQIPILIIMFIGTVVAGGAGYVAYEVTKPFGNISKGETDVKTEVVKEVSMTEEVALEKPTDDTQGIVPAKVEVEKTNTKDERNTLFDSLKKQIEELTQKKNEPVPQEPEKVAEIVKTVTLPNGAIVELDANGNITRTIKEVLIVSSPVQSAQVQTQTSGSALSITSVSISPTRTSAVIEWQTNQPTESKVFISGGNLSSTKVFASVSGLSTRHTVTATGLIQDALYTYEIEAISGVDKYVKKAGEFRSLPLPTITLSVAPNPVPFDYSTAVVWDSKDAQSCVASSYQKNGVVIREIDWNGKKPTSGSQSLGNLFSILNNSNLTNIILKLECEGNDGKAEKSIDVLLKNPPFKFIGNPEIYISNEYEYKGTDPQFLGEVHYSVQFQIDADAKPWPSQTLSGKCLIDNEREEVISVWGVTSGSFYTPDRINGAVHSTETGYGDYKCWFIKDDIISPPVSFSFEKKLAGKVLSFETLAVPGGIVYDNIVKGELVYGNAVKIYRLKIENRGSLPVRVEHFEFDIEAKNAQYGDANSMSIHSPKLFIYEDPNFSTFYTSEMPVSPDSAITNDAQTSYSLDFNYSTTISPSKAVYLELQADLTNLGNTDIDALFTYFDDIAPISSEHILFFLDKKTVLAECISLTCL